MPRVSVIIPTYNRSQMTKRAIESVLAQTYTDFEIIVVDDASTDDTPEVLSTFGNRIRIITQPHAGNGGGPARNTGIHNAQGELIAFLDSDDTWKPTKLERQMDFFNENPYLQWVYTDAEFIDGKTGSTLHLLSHTKKLYEGDVLEQLLYMNFIPFSSLVVNREVFDVVGDLLPLTKGTDWDINLRIASLYPVGLIRNPLVCYSVHLNSVTGENRGRKAYDAYIGIIERAVERDPIRLQVGRRKAISRVSSGIGKDLARMGNLDEAKGYFSNSIKMNPLSFYSYLYWLSCLPGEKVSGLLINLRRLIRNYYRLSKTHFSNNHFQE